MRCSRCRRCTFCQANECCAYIYTSGTTGSPKAVMISHDNIVFETRTVMRSLEIIGTSAEEERVISYLPLSHVAGMMVRGTGRGLLVAADGLAADGLAAEGRRVRGWRPKARWRGRGTGARQKHLSPPAPR